MKSFQNFFASKRAAGTQIAHWNYLRRALSEEMRHIETMQVPRLFVWNNCLGMMDDSIVKEIMKLKLGPCCCDSFWNMLRWLWHSVKLWARSKMLSMNSGGKIEWNGSARLETWLDNHRGL